MKTTTPPSNGLPIMLTSDWMELLRASQDDLRKRGWTFAAVDRPSRRVFIRDANGYCPLCALADVWEPTSFRGAWMWALEESLGYCRSQLSGAAMIAAAADGRRQDEESYYKLRKELIEILNVRRP